MWSFIWHTFFFNPVYNVLAFFIDTLPHGDVGIAIVLTVIVIKVLLLPLSIKVTKMQAIMRDIDPRIKELKEKITDKQEQAKAMMELYKEAHINPFANIFLLLIQFPIIIALYLAVSSRGMGVHLPSINTDLLYSFIPIPQTVSMLMFGFFDITKKSLLLALTAGATQFISVRLSMPAIPPRDPATEPNLKDDFTRSMQMQMRYVMPVIITMVAYSLSAAIALYFTISNLMMIVQELVVRRHRIPSKEDNT
jgi:YidC/Oxa1 family membrane protein insertase